MASNVRKFDYEKVSEIYSNMNNIIGSTSDPASIAGILYEIDKKYHDSVNVSEEALYGPLGQQLLLDWENTSSDFPKFLDSFANWSSLVSAASGKYADFEKEVQGVKEAYSLGITGVDANGNAITQAYTNTDYFSNFDKDLLDTGAKLCGEFAPQYATEYVDTNFVEICKQQKKADVKQLIWTGVDAALTVFAVGKALKGAKALASTGNVAKTGAKASAKASTKTSSLLTKVKGSKAGQAVSKAGSSIKNSKVVQGTKNFFTKAKSKVGNAISTTKTKAKTLVEKIPGVSKLSEKTAAKNTLKTLKINSAGEFVDDAGKVLTKAEVTEAVKKSGVTLTNKAGTTLKFDAKTGNWSKIGKSGTARVASEASVDKYITSYTKESAKKAAKINSAVDVISPSKLDLAKTGVKNFGKTTSSKISNLATKVGTNSKKIAVSVGTKISNATPQFVKNGAKTVTSSPKILSAMGSGAYIYGQYTSSNTANDVYGE